MSDAYIYDDQPDSWFGTGLRAHLGISPEPADEPPAAAMPGASAEEPALPYYRPTDDSFEVERRAQLLDLQERELAERVRWLEVREAELATESERLEQESARLTQRAKRRVKRRAAGRPLREVLRELAEQRMDSVVLVFEEALEATFDDGTPDLATRIAAARALLAVASGERAESDADDLESAGDELAALRKRRTSR
jgi:hypothetical protein